MALQEMTWTTFSTMGSSSVSSSPLARQRTAAAWTLSRERCCSWRPRPRGGLQDGPDPDSLSSDRASTKKTRWVGWTVNWGPINADFLLAQETHLPKEVLAAEESWMRSQGWRACSASALSSQHGEWSPPSRRRAAKEARGSWLQQLRHGLATPHSGVGDRGIEFCKGRVAYQESPLSKVARVRAERPAASKSIGRDNTKPLTWQIRSLRSTLSSEPVPVVWNIDLDVRVSSTQFRLCW